MSQAQSETNFPVAEQGGGWSELWSKEDYWAIWIGLAIVVIGAVLFAQGESWRYVAVLPPRWTAVSELLQHLAGNWPRYVVQFALWTLAFSGALAAMGRSVKAFVPSFVLLYVLSLVVFIIGQWDRANYYGFEAPLVALLLGLAVANLTPVPRSLEAGFRVEFYIKTAIVLLGATLAFTLILWAGPVAILQASIVSLVTFGVIFAVAVKLDEGDRPRRVDRNLVLRSCLYRDDLLGKRRAGAQSPLRRNLAAVPEIRARIPLGVPARHRRHTRLRARRFQPDRQSRLRRADQGFADLNHHLLLSQHRADDALS